MRLKFEQLDGQLAKGLAPVYVIAGDEPYQVSQAADAVRAAARKAGYGTREVYDVDSGFDWNELAAAAASLSLFSDRRVIDLRVPPGKFGVEGGKALVAYAERPAEDTVLLITTGKLDRQQQDSKWFTALDGAGVSVVVYPVPAEQLPRWIAARLRARGFVPDEAACGLLAGRVEGNLLAAAQEIEKLALLCEPGPLDAEQVEAAVADSARFDVFALSDAILAGDAARCLRVLEVLQAEGEGAVLVVWAVARELRALARIHADLAAARNEAAAMGAQRVWDKRKPLVSRALRRLDLARTRALLADCARLDRVSKGMAPGDPWTELRALCTRICGMRGLERAG